MKLEDVPVICLVASGKGGVGKTTVSSDIARTAKRLGANVGSVDTDISTPNSPEVVGAEEQDLSGQRLSTGDALVPPEVNGIQLASQGTVLPDDVPVRRDGSWRAEAVADYIENVEWDDGTDIVVIDSPPGTGEELQVVAAAAPPDQAFVVTTPHPSAVRDATKTHEFFKQADIDHELIVNMAHIPRNDVIQHVFGGADFGEVSGVGEATVDAIEEMFRDTVPDFRLFGYDPEAGVDIPADQAATLPYSEDFEFRSALLEERVQRLLPTEGVEV